MDQALEVVGNVASDSQDGPLGAYIVKLWVQLSHVIAFQLVVDILLKHCFDHQGPSGVEHIVKRDVVLVKDQRPIGSAGKGVENVWQRQDEVLIEKVKNTLGVSQVAQPAMVHEEPPQELEFTQGEVTGLDGTHAFVTIETNSYMSFSDH